MNFGFSEEQDLLRRSVRGFLDEQCPLPEVRKIARTADGYSPELWRRLAALGWLGLLVAEEHGGAGLGWEDLVVVLEETGRTLFPSPFLSHTLVCAMLQDASSAAQQARWLPALATGTCIGAPAIPMRAAVAGRADVEARPATGAAAAGSFTLHGALPIVADAAQADLLLIAASTGRAVDDCLIAAVEADRAGVVLEPLRPLDATRRAARLRLDGVAIPPGAVLAEGAAAREAIARHLDRGALATAAEALGTAEGAHAITVQFAKDRVQFGSPIGRYQGVKHPLAERYVEIESLKSLVYYAAWALGTHPDRVPVAASRAKALASEALLRMGVDGIQLHGAVGYTEEYDIQLYLKRSKWARPAFGDEDHHYERIATLGGL